ncbi:hypothetical protein H0H93_006231 [Arthromyces matolae]|nr:hypothetical protein H0H93_006231 [Arthromyces matolae]
MAQLSLANPGLPMSTFISETLPPTGNAFAVAPRQYDTLQNGLLDLQFNWDPKNRFSAGVIWNNVEYLARMNLQGMSSVQHLVIVAASTPVDGIFGLDAMDIDGSGRWHQVALRLSQLRLQETVEEAPSFPIDDTKVVCRLSTRRRLNMMDGNPSHGQPMPQRVLPRRNYSFPLPSHTNLDHNLGVFASPNESENPTSLVAQLQQVHGLTKKKVYGAKPPQSPFVRDERMRRDTPFNPAPLVLPSLKTSPLSPNGGKTLSTSKAARIHRVAQSSPSEQQSGRPGIFRRNSRLSSPETEPQNSSYDTASNVSSPVSPTGLTHMYMHSTAMDTGMAETRIDSRWGAAHPKPMLHNNVQLSSSHPPPFSMRLPMPTLAADGWQSSMTPSTATPFTPSEPSHSPTDYDCYFSSPGADVRRVTGEGSVLPPKPSPRRSSCPSDDEPFTFPAEYVAATETMFRNEVLPAYPDLQPAFPDVIPPRRAFYIAQDQSAPSSPTSLYEPGELYATTEREEIRQKSFPQSIEQPAPPTRSPVLSYATSYSPGSSSSLTGWAG